MKTSDNYSITIPKPCSESWSTMDQNLTGRYCHSCSKNVIDFTQKSNSEIHAIIQGTQGAKICGRFRNDQLNKFILNETPQSKSHLFGSLAGTFLALFNYTTTSAQEHPISSSVVTPKKSTEILTTPLADTIHVVTIRGVVIEGGLPLPGASIMVKDHNWLHSQSDMDGKFEIEIPKSMLDTPIMIETRFISFETIQQEIASNDILNNNEIKVTMLSRNIEITVGAVVPALKKKSLWKKLTSLFQ
ncbi:hypothetical protein E6C50_00155 [Flavobacterium supellecticarium]|uniref:CarboxypepD_reg-like domain-containing protein n=1 Tax=Flavobacterium supellecticarium TaxID=2565924 RepID=A0A4S4A2P1_9FLAO|nr:carboxypeptidase-like regulatory domain-containing protein [Flavobacterium supellecticarium]THF52662.1 hypothetical protein E6C50_00155 [Flavobacterium supellecticarium]